MDLAHILTNIVTIVVLYEFIEHLIFPLAWSIIMRKRKPLSGIESMVGKETEVKNWQDTKGVVLINGELWKASSDHQLLPGDKAIIEKVDGLLLRVTRCNED